MATNFPTSVDDGTTLPDPAAGNFQNSPSHSSLHGNANGAVKAIEAKVGTGASTPTNNTFLLGNGVGTSAWGTLTSAQMASRVSDETGSGSLVFATTPTLVTPKVDTINENTPANGVNIDGLNIKDGKLNTTDSVVTANYTDDSIKPEHLVTGSGTTWVWQTWAPTWANFTVGNATTSYRYTQIGKLVVFSMDVLLGTTSAMGTGPTFTLPVASVGSYRQNVSYIGNVGILDVGTQIFKGSVYWSTTTIAGLQVDGVGGTYTIPTAFTAAVPMGWATGDAFNVIGSYEAP
jgi:hypothetical protein